MNSLHVLCGRLTKAETGGLLESTAARGRTGEHIDWDVEQAHLGCASLDNG
jgi:hypothetical protein